MTILMALLSKAYVCDRLFAGIVGSKKKKNEEEEEEEEASMPRHGHTALQQPPYFSRLFQYKLSKFKYL
jgi:hypothetical protein